MKWFNKERTRTVLTFPVETMALLTKDGDVLDKEYGDFTAEMYAEGHSFFTYMSDNADSLSSSFAVCVMKYRTMALAIHWEPEESLPVRRAC